MNLSIIIPVKNEASLLKNCLRSINSAASANFSYEIIVVDNGSVDESQAVARDHGAIVKVAPNATVGELRNIGVEHTTGDTIAFIDADCAVQSDWFQTIAPYITDSQTVCFGSPPKPPVNGTWVQECWFQIRKKTCYQRSVFEVEWLESMNLFVRRDTFRKLGGFDESMVTCEDYDLCKRIATLGSVTCDLRIVALHHGEAASVREFYAKERWRGVSNLHSLSKRGFDLSELPSVVFPAIHLVLCLLCLIGVFLVSASVLSLTMFLLGVLVWQTPLFLLSFKKNGSPLPFTRAIGIVVLLNIYFVARGLSLFSPASWNKSARDGAKALFAI